MILNSNYSFRARFCFEFPTSKTDFILNSMEMRRLKAGLSCESAIIRQHLKEIIYSIQIKYPIERLLSFLMAWVK